MFYTPIRQGEPIFKGGKASPEAVSGRATYTRAAVILYAGLAAGVLGEEGCLSRRVSVDDVIRYCTHDCIVTVIEGSEPVVDKKKGSLRQCAGKIRYTMRGIWSPGATVVTLQWSD